MTEPKSIIYKCDRCGCYSNDFDYTFKKRREWGELFFNFLKIPIWIVAAYFMTYYFDTKGYWVGFLCLVVLLLLWAGSRPIIRCPRCDGREIKEIYHY
jgi:hypothetical protein